MIKATLFYLRLPTLKLSEVEWGWGSEVEWSWVKLGEGDKVEWSWMKLSEPEFG